MTRRRNACDAVSTVVGQAVDNVRKREHRALAAAGDDTLSGSPSSRPLRSRPAHAWELKESVPELWHYTRVGGPHQWKRWTSGLPIPA